MKIKLIDVDTSLAGEEEAGTCQICFRIEWCDNPIFIFQTADGRRININGYWWDWGDYHEVEIDNVIRFDQWLRKQDYPADTNFDEEWLCDTARKYNSEVNSK